MGIRNRVLVGALTLGTALGGLALTASPASAATVTGCAQGWSEKPTVCISMETGNKNTRNHTQWVSKVTVSTRWPAGPLEAWAGNGPTGVAWYRSGNGQSATWTVNMWIKTNSGVCGAYSFPDGSGRNVACLTIKA